MNALFGIGATIGFAGAFWQGSAKTFRYWAAGAAALALAPMMTLSVKFLWLLLVPALSMAVAFWFEKIPGRLLLIYVLSDLCVALAVSSHYQAGTEWSLPAPGSWEAGVGLLGAAALLRLGATVVEAPRLSMGLVLLGWWQGALLAWLAGSSASSVLVLGGVLLVLGFIALRFDSSTGPLVVFGGIVAMLAASGADPLAVVAVGLAGTAFILGDRAAAIWAAALPLSAPAALAWSAVGVSPIPIIAGVPLTAVAVYRLVPIARSTGGRLTAVAAVALTMTAVPDQTLRWLLYAVAVSGVVTLTLTKAKPIVPSPLPAEVISAELRPAMLGAIVIPLFINVVLAARLTLIGLSTGFL